jgi:hypothetical protein
MPRLDLPEVIQANNPIDAAIAETINIQRASDRLFEAVIDVNDFEIDRRYADLCKAAEALIDRAQYLAVKAAS